MVSAEQKDTQSIVFVVLGETEHELELAREMTKDTDICTSIFVEIGAAEHSLNAALDQCSACRMVVIAAHKNGKMLQNVLTLTKLAKERGLIAIVKTPHCGRTHEEFLATESLTMEHLTSCADCILLTPIMHDNALCEANVGTQFYRDVQCFQQYLTDVLDGNNFICLDFEDISSVLKDSGFAYFGAASITGVDTAERKTHIKHMEILPIDILSKAKSVIMHIVGSYDIGLEEVEAAGELVQPYLHPDGVLVFGAAFDDELRSKVQVSILTTGIID